MSYLRAAICAILSIALANSAQAQTNPIVNGSVSVKLQTVATVTNGGAPDFLTTTGVTGDGRLFAVNQSGIINLVSGGSSTAFFNVAAAINNQTATGQTGTFSAPGSLSDEFGLLGLAFAPDFSTTGHFYTFSSENPGTNVANSPTFQNHDLDTSNGTLQSVIREWTVNPSSPNFVNSSTATSRVIMRIRKPQSNHNGGTIIFGPDKFLYIGTGDGGGSNDGANSSNGTAGDGHTDGITNGRPAGNAQNTAEVYGKMLRINPTASTANDTTSTTLSTNGQYRIPNNNPFATSGTALHEIYAYGLRNSYRFSFDKATSKLYAADVGQGQREEIDSIVSGGNYGWVLKEGTRTQPASTIGGPYDTSGFSPINPIGEYTHSDTNLSGLVAVIGGFVYRGSLIPALVGKYVFGDLGASQGRLFYMDISDPGPNQIFQLALQSGSTLPTSVTLHGFGQDANGEIYSVWANGAIIELVREPATWLLAIVGIFAGLSWHLNRVAIRRCGAMIR